MGLYKEIMEAAEIVRKDDNLNLYKKLLDLSSQALDLQEEISRLREEKESAATSLPYFTEAFSLSCWQWL